MPDFSTVIIWGSAICAVVPFLYGVGAVVRMFLDVFGIWTYSESELREMDKRAEVLDREMRQYSAEQRRDNIFW